MIANLASGARAAAVQGSGDDVSARLGEVGVRRRHGEVEAALAQQLGQPTSAARAIGGDDDPVLLGDQLGQPLGQPLAVADHRAPTRGLHHRRVGVFGRRAQGPHRLRAPEQAIGVGVQPRELAVGVAGPRGGQRASEVVFLGEQIVGPVAHAPRFDEGDLARCGQQVGDQRVAVDQPRQPALHPIEHGALCQAFPLLASPRLLGYECLGAGANGLAGQQLARREDAHFGEVVGAALIVDRELGQAIDLVAPQVDADRRVGGRREHVDDRAAPGDFAAVLDEVFAAVAEADQRVEQRVGVDDVVGADDDRLDLDRLGAQSLQQGATRDDDPGVNDLLL